MQAQAEEKLKNQSVDIQHIKNLLLQFWRADDESVKTVVKKVLFAALDATEDEQNVMQENLS